MATARDKVIQYLQDARAAEYAFATLLATNVALTPEGDYRRHLESQRGRCQERENRLSERLRELGARRSLRHLGFDLAKAVAGQAVAVATMPVRVLRVRSGEELLLKNARDLCAAAAVLVADYRALEQIAHGCKDAVTAKLAVDLRSASEDLLTESLDGLDRFADAVITGEVGGERVYQPGSVAAVQMLRLPQLRGSMDRLRDEAVDVLRFTARRGAMQTEEERATRNRPALLETVRERHGNEPWFGYDEMNANEVRSRMRAADDGQVRAVLDYERKHKRRSSIINAPEVRRVGTAQPA